MSRRLVSWFLLVTVCLLIVGCGTKQPQQPGNAVQSSANKQTKYVSIGTSGSGGTYGAVGTAMTKVINDHTNIVSNVEATAGGGNANIRLLGSKQLTFGIATTEAGYSAYRKEGTFAKDDCTNVRTVLFGLENQMHIIVPKESRVQSVSDLRGLRIGTVSSANAEMYVPQVLEAYGISKNDVKIVLLSTGESAEALKDGNVDAVMGAVIGPSSAYMDLAVSRPVRFLSISEDKIKFLSDKYPYYLPTTIKAGTYKGQDADVKAISIYSALYTHNDVPEDVVYEVTKALLENNDELTKIHPAGASFSLENQKPFLTRGEIIPPLHPGTIKYYSEKGIQIK